MRDLNSGNVLANRYTLKRRLGSGAFTETWLATDRMTRASVALKILTDSSRAEVLRREWQLSLQLMHAHIVRVFEFGEDDDLAFYSQQFIDGPTLSAMSGAPAHHSLPAIAAVADALRYAHAKDIVHRDIKAANVLLDQNGAAYLIDFGVAATGGEDIGGGSLIASSPQLLQGKKATASDDIFALGGLVYEILSGRSAYSSSQTADDILKKRPPELDASVRESLPEGLEGLLRRMLDKDAAARPAAADIVSFLGDAGFPPGTVPESYLGESTEPMTDVAPASIQPTRIARKAQPQAAGGAERPAGNQGLRPAVVGVALVILLSLLIAVVFLLPKGVEPNTVPVADKPAADPAPAVEVPAPDVAGDLIMRDERVQARAATEEVLGELLAKLETLESRAVARWGGLPYARARAAYEAGDAAYLRRDYAAATASYEEAITLIDPLLDKVDRVFEDAMDSGESALANANASEAVDFFELAVAMSPNSTAAKNGLSRARNLDTVLGLIEQGLEHEDALDLNAARESFASAVELDPVWQPAAEALQRVNESIRQRDFESRMSEGIAALADGDFPSARAAFRMAGEIRPGSPEAADGLLQVDQGMRLESIRSLEARAARQEENEQWEEALATYSEILDIDATLVFAQDGQRNARERVRLHEQLDEYMAEPDSLSSPRTLQQATNLLIDITRMQDIGPRLSTQRDELSRLLKRASTPLPVQLVSDNQTAVSIYKVGRLGSFETRELELRPGTYVAVGSRPGFRDVRLEFRVGPEVDMQPVVVRCEEPI